MKMAMTPNMLTMTRGILGLMLPLMLLSGSKGMYLLACPVFTIAALTDYWDGALARRKGLESQFGRIADPTMDKILILAPLMALSYLGLFSKWWLVPIIAREIIITFCRIAWIYEGKAIGAEKLGKVKFVFQVISVSVAYFYFLSTVFEWFYFASVSLKVFLEGSLILTVFLTIASGVSFVVSNRMLFQTARFAKFTSALGVGFIPLAPGTWGSLLGIVLVILTSHNIWLYVLTFIALFWIGHGSVAKLDLSQNKDPGYVVIDECCGVFVVFFLIPLSPMALLAGFFLFRIFDIVKPYPLRKLENFPGYWGILADDLGAGFYSWIILRFLFGS